MQTLSPKSPFFSAAANVRLEEIEWPGTEVGSAVNREWGGRGPRTTHVVVEMLCLQRIPVR
jgi:hypothetical protein